MLQRSCFSVALSLFAFSALVHAQSSSPQEPEYTFHVGSRIVLTDVTVTDRSGNPVHGLKASDFQILDNNKPQLLASFEEHATPVAPMEQTSGSPGVYSNDFLQHLPPALNIIVIDITNLDLPDQMYLSYELNRFIRNLPAGQPLAIFWQSGESNLLLQSLTTDRNLLLAAVRKAIPRFPPPDRGTYTESGYVTLQTIENNLAQYPGRKNILWFSGGSSLFLHTDPLDPQVALPLTYPDPALLRDIYDELEASRIAIYPVDARGLQSAGIGPYPSGAAFAIAGQQGLMKDIANATGGTAFYNNNALDKIAAHWIDNAGSFYTLTYSPKDFRFDNKWHTVKVKLSAEFSGYTLSYRRGYFADATTAARRKEKKPRVLLRSNGDTQIEPDRRSVPIIFQVHVAPASQKRASSTGDATASKVKAPEKGTIPYSIHYSLPASDFTIKTVHGQPEVEIGVAVLAFNDQGSSETRLANQLTFAINEDNLRLHPKALIPADQQIDLQKGQKYLYLAVWDMTSGRLGTLQIPLKVVPEPKQPKL